MCIRDRLLGIYSDAYRNRIKAEKNAKVKNELKKQYEKMCIRDRYILLCQ